MSNKVHPRPPGPEPLAEELQDPNLQLVGPTPSIWASLKGILGSFKEQNAQHEVSLDDQLNGILGEPSYATQGSREPPRQGARGGAVGPPSQPNQYHYDEEEEYLHEDDGLHPHNVAHDFGFGADMHAQQQHGEEEEKADASGGSWTWKAFVKSECACLLAC